MLRARYVMRVTNFAVPDGRRIATTEQCHNPCAPRPKSTVRTNSTTFNNVTQNCNFVVEIDVFFLLLFSFVFLFFFSCCIEFICCYFVYQTVDSVRSHNVYKQFAF